MPLLNGRAGASGSLLIMTGVLVVLAVGSAVNCASRGRTFRWLEPRDDPLFNLNAIVLLLLLVLLFRNLVKLWFERQQSRASSSRPMVLAAFSCRSCPPSSSF
jgi:hypothetical protein